MKENKNFAIAVGALIIGGIAVIVWLGANKPNAGSSATTPVDTAALTAVVADDYVAGPEAAPVTLIEYLDFECEACGAYFPLIKELEAAYPNDLKVVKRYFPLPGHKNGLPAALAVEAAGRQGKFNEMHDLLFQEQKTWGEKPSPTPEVFEAYATQLGLDMEQFKKDVASPQVKARIQRDIDSGRALGARGTPTFILNGVRIDNPQGLPAFKGLIDTALGSTTTSATFGVTPTAQ